MKQAPFLQSLSQRLGKWRRQYKKRLRELLFKTSKKWQIGYSLHGVMANLTSNSISIYTYVLAKIPKNSPVLFAIAVLVLTGVMGQKFYNQPQMIIGSKALVTVLAPYTDTIENIYETQEKRQVASNNSVPILMVDVNINQNINEKLQEILEQGNQIRVIAGYLPDYADTTILSVVSQRYLRAASSQEWQAFQDAISPNNSPTTNIPNPHKSHQRSSSTKTISGTNCQDSICFEKLENSPLNNRDKQSLMLPTANFRSVAAHTSKKISGSHKISSPVPKQLPADTYFSNTLGSNSDFLSQALTEIQTRKLTTSKQNISALIQEISRSRQRYVQAKAKIAEFNSQNPNSPYNNDLVLDLSSEDWINTQTIIQQTAQRILAQGIPPGLPQTILEDAIKRNLEYAIPVEAEPFASKLLLATLQPNLKKDEAKTQIQAKNASAVIKPVMIAVQQGDIIVRKGEIICDWDFQILEHYGLIRREVKWLKLIILAGMIIAAVAVFVMIEKRVNYRKRQRDRILILLLTLSIPLVLTMGTSFTTWSASGLLLGSLYGSTIGVTAIGLLTLLLPFSLEISRITLVAGAAGALLGSCMAKKLRSREELALLGIGIAIVQSGVYLIFKICIGSAFSGHLYAVLKESLLFACSGLSWSIVALGLSPYLEQMFDLVTPIRLAELANPNRPLLKRLAAETPGTFQHTLFVSSLAEAAARKLECNVELVRAGTLYHDIGKMHDPQAFIENQMGAPNKHDTEINNPWLSAKIIKKHVSEGLVMARKYRLPTEVQAFIPEHQGTMQIAYFYHQAQQIAKTCDKQSLIRSACCIQIDHRDFCYDGPIPQSKETAIVMLADSCEAALRSLKDATPEQALSMLNNILRARWQDKQLVDSGLTRNQMSEIAEIFVEVWQQFHHKRIAYPQSKAGTTEK
ncbi:HD family phosphohydrolase [Brunnivagina elsteri]|uniref:Phosphohydrolase n=1 Tax=Brunnivagina elsteri CCALA 953 TaxID=987040 RepID=A0A2A2TNR4_9CYAN|nr:HDIG domain-containing metalloprotein [Calothrix elsteri]PAX60047.1 phosphohydrolase [Calothrix elsteri CCALA 953]